MIMAAASDGIGSDDHPAVLAERGRCDDAKPSVVPARALPAALSLRANAAWLFVGNTVYAGCQWLMLVVLAKFGDPQMVGQFALAIAIVTPVILFGCLQLRVVQATDARAEYEYGDYLGLRILMMAFSFGVIAAITLLVGYPTQTAWVIAAFAVGKIVESISDTLYGGMQRLERMDLMAGSMMVKGLLSLLALAATLYLTGSLLWAVIAIVLSWLLILVLYDVRCTRSLLLQHASRSIGATPRGSQGLAILGPRWNTRKLRSLAQLALPLGAVMMLLSLNTNIPRYVLERVAGERDLGLFAAIAYILMAGYTAVGALGQAASPRLAKYHADEDRPAFNRLLMKLLGAGLAIGVLGVLAAVFAGPFILRLLYTAEYAEHNDVFVWIMLAAAATYLGSFLGYACSATRAFHRFVVPYSVLTMVATVSSLALIPKFGLLGAAWATCITSVAGCVVPILILRSVHKSPTHEPAA